MNRLFLTAVLAATVLTANAFAQDKTFFQTVAGNWEGTLEYQDYSQDKRVKLKTYLTITPAANGNSAEFVTVYDDFGRIIKNSETVALDLAAKKYVSGKNVYEIASVEQEKIVLLGSGQDGERIEVGDLVIDKRRHEVIRNGSRVDLTPLEFQILELLASEPGRAWSRNALLDRVWSTDYEGYQRNIDPHINRLRKKLEADPKNPRYVLTVRGVGYKLNEIP